MQSGHDMKKKTIFFVILVIVVAMMIRMLFFHFIIKADAIYTYNVVVDKNAVEFDVTLNEGFYGIVDYSYEEKDKCLAIVFYGSYVVNRKSTAYINHVSIVPDEEIQSIVIKSKHKTQNVRF